MRAGAAASGGGGGSAGRLGDLGHKHAQSGGCQPVDGEAAPRAEQDHQGGNEMCTRQRQIIQINAFSQ